MAKSRRGFSLSLVRLGAYFALFAGAAWTVLGFITAITLIRGGGVHSPAFLGSVLYVVALVGTLGGIVGLHFRQASGYGLLGKVGFAAAFSGTALLLAGLVLIFALGDAPEPALLDPVLALALWDALAGFALLGVATLRLATLPPPCGWALLTCPPLALLFGDYGGGMVLGLAWLVVGYALLSQRDVSALLRTKSR
jgi:hypothetical protein